MSMSGRATALLAEERGAVLVFVAVFAPVAILLLAFVIDTGNWFGHKRHLQLQADAAALSTAQAFNSCLSDKGAGDSAVYQSIGQYGGVTAVVAPGSVASGPKGSLSVTPPIYNTLGVTTQDNLHALVNSQTYYNQNSPVDSGVPSTNADPCATAMADVKLTETNLPWYFKALNVPFINAHARVSILQETSEKGALPVAATETVPESAAAYLIDESNGSVLSTCGPSGTATCAVSLTNQGAAWSNSAAPLAMKVQTSAIGVRIALSGTPGITPACGGPTVACYDANSSSTGLLHLQGWSNSGTGSLTTPLARAVTLSTHPGQTGSCTDFNFSNATASCTFSISAGVDIGTSNISGVSVTPNVGGTSLTYNSTTGLWTGTETLAPGSGANPINLTVKCDNAVSGSPCASSKKGTSASINNVQSIYSALASSSGPIQSAQLLDAGAGNTELDTARVCETGNTSCTHNLVVSLGLTGSLQDNSGQLVSLRVAGGSQSQEVDCGGGNIRDELHFGCTNTYQQNTSPTLACAPATSPPSCVPLQTGEAVGQVTQGLNDRFGFTSKKCSGGDPNVWPNWQSDPRRVVQTFVTPFDSFTGSGNALVPILTFASMYVAGWTGDPCIGQGDPADPDVTSTKGDIWGYFISYVNSLGTGTGSGACATNAFGTCIAVLTQ